MQLVLKNSRSAVALALGLVVAACAPGFIAPPVTPELASRSRTPAATLARGYALHEAKCAKCHAYENPANYPLDELRDEIMPSMARKSKLAPAEAEAVLAYLLAAREAQLAAAASKPQ